MRRRLLSAACLTATLFAGTVAGIRPLEAATNHWTRVTPDWGPYPTFLAVHPADPSIVYALGDGFWKTVDAGAHWTLLPILPPGYFAPIALDPSSKRVLYAAAPPGGVRQSSDGGETWSPMPSGSAGLPSFGQLAVAAWDPATLFGIGGAVAEPAGLFRSTDSGATWHIAVEGANAFALGPPGTQVVYAALSEGQTLRSDDGGVEWRPLAPPPVPGLTATLAADGVDPDTAYLATLSGLLRTRDAGTTWVSIADATARTERIVAVPGVAGAAYAMSYPEGAPIRLERTLDYGETWETLPSPNPASWPDALAPVAGDADRVYLARRGVYSSENAGQSWTLLGQAGPAVAGTALSVRRGAPDRVYAGGADGGIGLSDDGGASWIVPLNSGLDGRRVLSISTASGSPGIVAVGTDRGLFSTTDAATTWQRLGPFDGASRLVGDLRPDLPLVAAVDTCRRGGCFMSSWMSTDGGARWSRVLTADGQDIEALLLLEAPSPVVIGISGGDLVRGDPALPLERVRGAPYVRKIAQVPGRPSALAVIGWYESDNANRFYYSADLGTTWQGRGLLRLNEVAFSLAVRPGDPNRILVGTDQRGILESLDGGLEWLSASPYLAETGFLSIAFSPDGETAYAGTELAIYADTLCDTCPRRVGPPRPDPRMLPPRAAGD